MTRGVMVMGMFTPKVICSGCGKEVGLYRFALRKEHDKWLCPDCFNKLNKAYGLKMHKMSTEEVKNFIENNSNNNSVPTEEPSHKCVGCSNEISISEGQKLYSGEWLCSKCATKLKVEYKSDLLLKSLKKEQIEKYLNSYDQYSLKTKGSSDTELAKSIDQYELEVDAICDTRRCKIRIVNETLIITINKMFSEPIRKIAKLTDVFVAENTLGKSSFGDLSLFINNLEKENELKIRYMAKDKWRIDSMVNQINSYFKEYKLICNQCGNEYYFDNSDIARSKYAAMMNISKTLMALGSNLSLAYLPDKEVEEFKRCKKCGSRNVDIIEIEQKR